MGIGQGHIPPQFQRFVVGDQGLAQAGGAVRPVDEGGGVLQRVAQGDQRPSLLLWPADLEGELLHPFGPGQVFQPQVLALEQVGAVGEQFLRQAQCPPPPVPPIGSPGKGMAQVG